MNRKSSDSATKPKRMPCRTLGARRCWRSKKISPTNCRCSRSDRRKSASRSKKLCRKPRKSYVKQKKTRRDRSINLITPKLRYWSILRMQCKEKFPYQKTRFITSFCRALRSIHTAKKVLCHRRRALSWGIAMSRKNLLFKDNKTKMMKMIRHATSSNFMKWARLESCHLRID